MAEATSAQLPEPERAERNREGTHTQTHPRQTPAWSTPATMSPEASPQPARPGTSSSDGGMADASEGDADLAHADLAEGARRQAGAGTDRGDDADMAHGEERNHAGAAADAPPAREQPCSRPYTPHRLLPERLHGAPIVLT